MKRVLKGVAAIITGAIVAFLAFLLGGAKARTRGEDDLQKEEKEAEKSAQDKVLAADPSDVVSSLDADTRARIDRAGEVGVEAGLGAARIALHRRGGAGGSPGGG